MTPSKAEKPVCEFGAIGSTWYEKPQTKKSLENKFCKYDFMYFFSLMEAVYLRIGQEVMHMSSDPGKDGGFVMIYLLDCISLNSAS